MVIPSYKGQVEATQKMVGPLDDLIKSKKDEVIETQKKLIQKLSGTLIVIFLMGIFFAKGTSGNNVPVNAPKRWLIAYH